MECNINNFNEACNTKIKNNNNNKNMDIITVLADIINVQNLFHWHLFSDMAVPYACNLFMGYSDTDSIRFIPSMIIII